MEDDGPRFSSPFPMCSAVFDGRSGREELRMERLGSPGTARTETPARLHDPASVPDGEGAGAAVVRLTSSIFHLFYLSLSPPLFLSQQAATRITRSRGLTGARFPGERHLVAGAPNSKASGGILHRQVVKRVCSRSALSPLLSLLALTPPFLSFIGSAR